MNELKPCPFCGGEAGGDANVSFDKEDRFFIEFSVGCKRCNVFIRRLAAEFADSIAPFMNVETEWEPRTNQTMIRARLRVIDPDYRF